MARLAVRLRCPEIGRARLETRPRWVAEVASLADCQTWIDFNGRLPAQKLNAPSTVSDSIRRMWNTPPPPGLKLSDLLQVITLDGLAGDPNGHNAVNETATTFQNLCK